MRALVKGGPHDGQVWDVDDTVWDLLIADDAKRAWTTVLSSPLPLTQRVGLYRRRLSGEDVAVFEWQGWR